MINLSSRKYRIWIRIPNESVGFEVTEACSGDSGGFFVVTDDPIDEDGIFRTKGTLELVVPPGQEIFYNTWEQRQRWEIGNYVVVQIADTFGVLRAHPRSNLRIISRPAPPYPGNPRLTLELADGNTWKETIPQDFQRDLSIAQGLTKLGLAFVGTVPVINDPSTKSSATKTAVAIAGERAIAGFSALYQNRNGAIASKRLNLKQEQRLFKHVVGVDDAGEFQPLQNALRPYSEVQVINPNFEQGDDEDLGGNGGEDDAPDGSTGDEDGSITLKEYVPAEQVREGGGPSEVLAAIRTERWSWTGNIFTRTIVEKRLLGLVIPQELYDQYAALQASQGFTYLPPSPFTMIISLLKEEVHTYEAAAQSSLTPNKFGGLPSGGGEQRLSKIATICKQPNGQVLADWHKRNPPKAGDSARNYVGLIDSETTSTRYTYQTGGGKDTGGQVRKVIAETYKPRGIVAGSATDWIQEDGSSRDPYLIVLSDRSVETWIKRGVDTWEHRSSQGTAGQVRSGKIASYLGLSTETTVEVSRTGNTQPPTGERRPPKEKKPRQKTLRFQTRSPESRVKIIENEFVDSPEQGEKIAEIFTLISNAREHGFQIYSAWRDELFRYSPFSRVDLDYNGYTYTAITDLATWTLGASQALVAIDCMRLGRVAIARYAEDTYPFPSLEPPSPGDPDPEPLPEPDIDNLNPESYLQNFIPIVTPLRELVSNQSADIVVRHFPIALGQVFDTLAVVSNQSSEIVFNVQLISQQTSEVVFRLTYLAISNQSSEIVFSTAEPGLVSSWLLDDLSWADEVGANPLTIVGQEYLDDFGDPQTGAVVVGVGEEDGAAEFDGHSYLKSEGSSLGFNSQSFAIAFKLWLPAILGQEYLDEEFTSNPAYSINNIPLAGSSSGEWDLLATGGAFGGNFTLRFTFSGGTEGTPQVSSAVVLTLATWHSIEARFDQDAQTISVTVDGTATSTSSDGNGEPDFSEFRLGAGSGTSPSEFAAAGVRIDEAKFYIFP